MLRKNKTSVQVLFYDAQGITTFLILATGFSEIQTASHPLQMASTVPSAHDCCLCTMPSLETNVGLF